MYVCVCVCVCVGGGGGGGEVGQIHFDVFFFSVRFQYKNIKYVGKDIKH